MAESRSDVGRILPAGPHAKAEVEPVGSEGDRRTVRVTIDVPFQLDSLADAILDIGVNSIRLRVSGSEEVCAQLPENFVLDSDEASAKFSRKKRQLVVTAPAQEKAPAPPAGPREPEIKRAAPALAVEQRKREEEVRSPDVVATPDRAGTGNDDEDDDDDDDDLPPVLEGARSAPVRTVSAPPQARPVIDEKGGPLEAADESNAAAQALMENALASREKKRIEAEEERRKADFSSGGGLKKGFFSASKPKKKASSGQSTEVVPAKKDEVTCVGFSVNQQEAKKQSLQLPEVQQAMKGMVNKMKDDQSWLTPQLMKALQSRPDLLSGLSNPRIMEAFGLMQTDPEKAKAKYANDPEVTDFLKEFSSLMATHFDVLSKEEPAQPGTKSSGAPAARSTSSAMQTPVSPAVAGQDAVILNDPAVQEAFRDPEVQQLLNELRMGRQLEFHELAQTNPRLVMKVKLLLDKGLLSMQH